MSTARIDLTLPQELDRALNELVVASGIAKASIIRTALAEYLAEHGALPREAARAIPLVPTHGPGLSTHKQKGPQ